MQSLGQSTLAKLPARLGAVLIASVLASGAATAASSLAQPMDLGATPADAVQTVSLVLKVRNPDQLERYIAATVDPDNPLFRRFLTVEQFRDFFAPREIEILRIRQALHVTVFHKPVYNSRSTAERHLELVAKLPHRNRPLIA